ncbi:DgyrCDS14831 [Dimorphilus gyrociliatus]|uniref:DgyrCDS14831 n=1 Tax=Dimorphilus gyrociliatus TaxID=2664684 RepID=A0A7I8WF12_9ANNE|nr:DgyrCDS14831 [Dimorphilus gyrociliatus]
MTTNKFSKSEFWFLTAAILVVVNGEDDIARNKLTFQSTTTYPNIASLATDSTIEINDPIKCSKTNQILEKAWWTVDLEKVYSVEKVCILNGNIPDAANLTNFVIKVSNFPMEGEICATVSSSIKIPMSTTANDYECFGCSPAIVGSFVYIEHQQNGADLQLCDVKVSGTFVKDRDYSALKMTSNDLYGVAFSSAQRHFNKAIDNDYSTYYQAEISVNKPYIMVRLPTLTQIVAVLLIPGLNELTSKSLQRTFVNIKHIPDTFTHMTYKMCFHNNFLSDKGLYEAVFKKCNIDLSGRYIYIGSKPSANSIFELTELVIYGKEREKTFTYSQGLSRKENIQSILINGTNLDSGTLNLLTDNIYYASNSLSISYNTNLIIAFNSSLLNHVCLTMKHKNIKWIQNPYITLEDLLTGNTTTHQFFYSFKSINTVCQQFSISLLEKVVLEFTDFHEISEIDLHGLTLMTYDCSYIIRYNIHISFEKY